MYIIIIMVNYTCPRCGYNINNITKYQKHLRRKKICENILSDDNLFDEYIKFNITEKLDNVHFNLKSLNSAENRQKTPKVNQNEPGRAETSRNEPKYKDYSDESSEDEKCYKCKYCKKKFNHSQSLNRHVKNRCKVKKENEKEKDEMNKMVDLLNKQLEDQKQQINELIKRAEILQLITNRIIA